MLYIYTVCYNTPDFIESQYRLLKKFIKNDFEYIVFNNTMTNQNLTQTNTENNNNLKTVCEKNNIKFYDIPREIFSHISDGDASRRAGTAIDFSHKILFNTHGLDHTFFLLDSDAFLLTDFDVDDFMKNHKMAGRIQYRKTSEDIIKYVTNQIVIYKPTAFNKEIFLKNFSFLPCSIGNANCDCGGKIHFILETMNLKNDYINFTNALFSNSGNVKQLFGGSPSDDSDFDMEYLNNENVSENLRNFIKKDTKILNRTYPFAEIFAEPSNTIQFLHLRAGTNWINFDIVSRKAHLQDFFDKL